MWYPLGPITLGCFGVSQIRAMLSLASTSTFVTPICDSWKTQRRTNEGMIDTAAVVLLIYMLTARCAAPKGGYFMWTGAIGHYTPMLKKN